MKYLLFYWSLSLFLCKQFFLGFGNVNFSFSYSLKCLWFMVDSFLSLGRIIESKPVLCTRASFFCISLSRSLTSPFYFFYFSDYLIVLISAPLLYFFYFPISKCCDIFIKGTENLYTGFFNTPYFLPPLHFLSFYLIYFLHSFIFFFKLHIFWSVSPYGESRFTVSGCVCVGGIYSNKVVLSYWV